MVARLLWEQDVAGSNPVTPTPSFYFLGTIMTKIITVQELEQDFDSYLDRCEAGETFFIEHEDGKLVAMVPAKHYESAMSDLDIPEEDWYNIYNSHNDAC